MERWLGKVAVVTGASAGIGAAIAKKLVMEGITVAGFARRREKLSEVAHEIGVGKGDARMIPIEVDITDEEDVKRGFLKVSESIGPVSILINNAGIVQLTTLVDGDSSKWRKVLDTNVLGLCVATREAVAVMREKNIDGHIVHINSVAGHRVPPIPYTNVYSASKFAVTSLAQTLRNELRSMGSKIKVTSISPGYVETDIVKANGFDQNETMTEIERNAPRMYPVDVANAVLYALTTPPHVDITELTLQPIGEMI